jgi:hypothetical protein
VTNTPYKSKFEEKRDKLIHELEQVNAELDSMNKLSTGQRLAVELHEMNCRHNHTDGCSWHYEKGAKAWDANTEHDRWYRRAMNATKFVDAEMVLKIAHAIKD